MAAKSGIRTRAGRALLGGGEQPEVPVLEDVQRGMGQQRAHDPRVHQRDQRVVVPCEMKVRCRISGRAGRLVQPAPARSWRN